MMDSTGPAGPKVPRTAPSGGAPVPPVRASPRPSLGTEPAGWLALTPLLWTAALLALSLQVVVLLAHAARLLAFPFDLDQGEAYDVNSGWLLGQGLPIYTSNELFPYYSSNYPPGYALAVSAAIKLWGPSLLAGRAVSLAATLGVGALLFWSLRRRAGAFGGAVAVGTFFLSNYLFHVGALARVNPLTLLLALAGALGVGRRTPLAVTGGSLLLVAAIFTKPTAVDAAAAAIGWLLLYDRKLAVWAAALVGGLVLGGGLWLDEVTGQAFSLNVIRGNVNPFVPGQLEAYLLNFGLLHAVPLLLAGRSCLRAVRARQIEVGHLLLLTGLLMALGVTKWGAGESYFLTAIAATSLLTGQEAARLLREQGWLARLAPLLLVGQCLVSAHGLVSTAVPALPDRGLQAAALAAVPGPEDLRRGFGIVSRLEAQRGPALLEESGFALVAGQEVVGNPTHLRNLQQAGLWRGDRLLADLGARRYHTVVLVAELYPEPVLAAIGRYYFLFDSVEVGRSEQQVFLPGAK
jgi:hypothetical protein